jgi:hypothetical protein
VLKPDLIRDLSDGDVVTVVCVKIIDGVVVFCVDDTIDITTMAQMYIIM